MVLKRIIEFENSQEDRRQIKVSGIYRNAFDPSAVGVSLDNSVNGGREAVDTHFYARPRFSSESKFLSTAANLPQNNRRSQSVTQGFGNIQTQDNINISRRDILNDAFRTSANSSCSYLSNRLDSVSSDGSVFSELTNLSPIPFHPLNKLNRDKLYSQSSQLSSSSKNIPLQTVNKSNPIKYFYELKDEKLTGKLESNDKEIKKLVESVKQIQLVTVKDSDNKILDAEFGYKISENELGGHDGITQQTSRMTHSIQKKALNKIPYCKKVKTPSEDDVFLTTQFEFENVFDDKSADFLHISPVPKLNLTSSFKDNDNNYSDNNVLIERQ